LGNGVEGGLAASSPSPKTTPALPSDAGSGVQVDQVAEIVGLYLGHPEPITLHRTLRPTGDAANAMVLRPSTAAYLDVLRSEIDKGRIDIVRAAKLLTKPRVVHLLRSLARRARFASPGNLPPFFAAVSGTKDGAPRTVLARLSIDVLATDMAEATGVPLALGLSQMCGGLAICPGVHPPDAIIDRDVFFAQLATHSHMDLADCLLIEQQGE
jgi:lysine 6-dehydrogenase